MLFPSLTLAMLASLTPTAHADQPTRSVQSSPALVALLGTMSDLAQRAPKPERFSFTEDARAFVNDTGCESESGVQVAHWFTEQATARLATGGLTPAPEALEAFADLVVSS